MTTQSTEADASTTTSTPRPVRVPNVSHGAVSGLGHEVIGGAVHEVYDAEQRVEHTQAGADPASPLGSDPTGGALPTGDVFVVDDHTVDQVNDYLAAHPDQTEAVLSAESTGQERKGILEGPHAPA